MSLGTYVPSTTSTHPFIAVYILAVTPSRGTQPDSDQRSRLCLKTLFNRHNCAQDGKEPRQPRLHGRICSYMLAYVCLQRWSVMATGVSMRWWMSGKSERSGREDRRADRCRRKPELRSAGAGDQRHGRADGVSCISLAASHRSPRQPDIPAPASPGALLL